MNNKIKKAQGVLEFALIGLIIFIGGFFIIKEFGHPLNNLFKTNKTIAMFSNDRFKNSITQYLSNVVIIIDKNKNNINSPIQSYYSSEENNLNETSGAIGEMKSTLLVIKEYSKELTKLIESLETNENKDTINKIRTLLADYQKQIDEYIAMDELTATDKLKKRVAELEILLDLGQNGQSALDLTTMIGKLLVDVDDSKTKKIIESFTNDMLNIGASIDYSIDSRIIGKKSNDILETVKDNEYAQTNNILTLSENDFIDEFNRKMNEIDKKWGLKFLNESSLESIKKFSQDPGRARSYIDNNLTGDVWFGLSGDELKTAFNDVATWLDAADAYIALSNNSSSAEAIDKLVDSGDLQVVIDYYNDMLADGTLSDEEIESNLKFIDVYRNGNYSELAPNSYNNTILCEQLGGTVSKTTCAFQ